MDMPKLRNNVLLALSVVLSRTKIRIIHVVNKGIRQRPYQICLSLPGMHHSILRYPHIITISMGLMVLYTMDEQMMSIS